MNWIDAWINSILKPKETFESEKNNASIGKGVLNYAISAVIAGVLIGLITIFLASNAPAGYNSFLQGFGVLVLLTAPTLFAIMFLLLGFVGNGVYFIVARIFGGTGSFTQQFYLTSLPMVPLVIIYEVLRLILVIPKIPLVADVLSLVCFVFGLYLVAVALKAVHGFNTVKAVIVTLTPVIIAVILLILLAAWLFGVLMPRSFLAAA